MDKISDKMRQDGAKMRKMKDVSSVFAPWRAHDPLPTANSPASRGAGEVPPLGWVIPSRRLPSFAYNGFFDLKMSKTLETSSTKYRIALVLFSTLRAKPR